MSDFSAKVKFIVKNISAGKTMSYRAVATEAGRPKAARAVATIMAKNYDPTVPCHRVIRSDGTPGDYNRGGEATKCHLLKREGVVLYS